MASSPFAFITILTTDTVNKTTSNEVAIGATNPCTASQNTSSMVNKNLPPLHKPIKMSKLFGSGNEEMLQAFSSLWAA